MQRREKADEERDVVFFFSAWSSVVHDGGWLCVKTASFCRRGAPKLAVSLIPPNVRRPSLANIPNVPRGRF